MGFTVKLDHFQYTFSIIVFVIQYVQPMYFVLIFRKFKSIF